jgi:hemerythrin-like domain-containing protein
VKQDLDRPADTSMMGIVHDALRRDMDRLRSALTTAPYPEGERRRALAEHAAWLLDFLHHHHAGEDAGLYPMVRVANPGAGALLDAMDAEHSAIHPCMDRLGDAAQRWGTSGSEADRVAVVEALDALDAVLRPHLDREEAEAMPVVSASITHRQWHEWDQATNVKPKSLTQLGAEGHWMLDGLDPRRRQILLHEVPAIPRMVLLYGFGPAYRRRAAARWGVPAGNGAS